MSTDDDLLDRFDFDIYGELPEDEDASLLDFASFLLEFANNKEAPLTRQLEELHSYCVFWHALDPEATFDKAVMALIRALVMQEILALALRNINARAYLESLKTKRLAD